MGFIQAMRPFWHPVIRSEDVRDRPVGVRLLDQPIVLWRSDDEIVALEDYCVHRGAALSLGQLQGENLECPYHGFQYGKTGRCVRIPSMAPEQPIPEKARVRKFHAKERYDVVWVALEEPEYDVMEFPEYDDSAFRTFLIDCGVWNANATRVIENNYDYTHTPFIHAGRLGIRSETEYPPIPVGEKSGNTIMQVMEGEEPNWAFVHQPGGTARIPTRYYNKLVLPLGTHTRTHTLANEKESDDAYIFVMATSPIAEKQSQVWLWVSRNYGWDIPDLEYERWEVDTLAQDRQFVESQRPAVVPTDPREELFVPNELHHVEYRRWLRSVGVE